MPTPEYKKWWAVEWWNTAAKKWYTLKPDGYKSADVAHARLAEFRETYAGRRAEVRMVEVIERRTVIKSHEPSLPEMLNGKSNDPRERGRA